MKNSDVIKAFLLGNIASSNNLFSSGDKLISYSTTIAQFNREDCNYYINNTKYSVTTSKAHNEVARLLDGHPNIIMLDDVPKNTYDLVEFYKNGQCKN